MAGSAGGSGHSETFLDPDYIKQRVYLHDALLRKLTLLEYLPFDDNVCVREPCLNFETCTPVLKFAGPENDVMLKASTLMLRSVDPLATYSCDCPQVRTLTQFLYVSFLFHIFKFFPHKINARLLKTTIYLIHYTSNLIYK